MIAWLCNDERCLGRGLLIELKDSDGSAGKAEPVLNFSEAVLKFADHLQHSVVVLPGRATQ